MKINLINEVDRNLPTVYQILVNRGISLENIEQFLNTTDEVINDYKLLNNIEWASGCFLRNYFEDIEMLIQVDSDVDGYTSASTLYNYLKSNYPGIKLSYQVHNEKVHGLDITEDILNKKYGLIFVPDAGSNQYEKHKQLHDLGIDIIVLDHHEAEHESEDAIVVNNQMSDRYPNKSISGVGIVWQFCRMLDSVEAAGIHKTNADDYLDLVALGLK